jgi:hypothetical protein
MGNVEFAAMLAMSASTPLNANDDVRAITWLRNLCQQVKQFLRDSVGEILLLLVALMFTNGGPRSAVGQPWLCNR